MLPADFGNKILLTGQAVKMKKGVREEFVSQKKQNVGESVGASVRLSVRQEVLLKFPGDKESVTWGIFVLFFFFLSAVCV